MNREHGLEITITDEGKEIIENIVVGCVKIIIGTLLTKGFEMIKD